jgi:hypothetical protein
MGSIIVLQATTQRQELLQSCQAGTAQLLHLSKDVLELVRRQTKPS